MLTGDCRNLTARRQFYVSLNSKLPLNWRGMSGECICLATCSLGNIVWEYCISIKMAVHRLEGYYNGSQSLTLLLLRTWRQHQKPSGLEAVGCLCPDITGADCKAEREKKKKEKKKQQKNGGSLYLPSSWRKHQIWQVKRDSIEL